MATPRSLRGNLAVASFPFVSDFQGRTIIVPQFDENFDRYLNAYSNTDKDKGVPQVFYMHNCVPTDQGFQSIGYEQKVPAKAPAVTDFDSFFLLRDSSENKALYIPALGNNYVYTSVSGTWQSVSPLAAGSFPSNGLVTIAYIHKRTFVFFEKLGCFEYDFTNNVFNPVVFSGLTMTALRGITASVGYCIAFDDTTIYWSNTGTETDFVPSLVTGAGSQIPNDVKGKIVAVLPIPQGFMIYSTKNVVSAFYSGNIRFPWIFREVPNSAGINSPENVAWQATLALQYAWTTAGLMKMDRTGAEAVFPEATDFITQKVFEDFDEVVGTFSTTYSTTEFKTKLSFIGARYLVLSYGLSSLTHALIYDTALKRWGKLKITHVDCFEWPAPNFFGTRTYAQLAGSSYASLLGTTYAQLSQQQFITTIPRKDICFLQQDGTIKSVSFDVGNDLADGVLLIGKYQFLRDQMMTLLSMDVENIRQSASFSVKWLTTFDGKTFQKTTSPQLNPASPAGLARRYQQKVTGKNHTLQWIGGFNAVSFQVRFTSGGYR